MLINKKVKCKSLVKDYTFKLKLDLDLLKTFYKEVPETKSPPLTPETLVESLLEFSNKEFNYKFRREN